MKDCEPMRVAFLVSVVSVLIGFAFALAGCSIVSGFPSAGLRTVGSLERPKLNVLYQVDLRTNDASMVRFSDGGQNFWDFSRIDAVLEVENLEAGDINVSIARGVHNDWDVGRVAKLRPLERKVVYAGSLKSVGVSAPSMESRGKLKWRVFIKFNSGILPEKFLFKEDVMSVVM